jgi:hypothetical protein
VCCGGVIRGTWLYVAKSRARGQTPSIVKKRRQLPAVSRNRSSEDRAQRKQVEGRGGSALATGGLEDAKSFRRVHALLAKRGSFQRPSIADEMRNTLPD